MTSRIFRQNAGHRGVDVVTLRDDLVKLPEFSQLRRPAADE
jgi:hypothetical protein